MSAIHSLKTLSDNALNGAIKQLSFSGDWPKRLRQLLVERDRRNGKKRNTNR